MEVFSSQRTERLTGADDGDEVVAGRTLAAAGTAGRDRAGDLVAVDFAEGRSLREFVGFAVGVRCRRAAFGAGSKAAVDAVAVGIVGDDEHLALCCRRTDGAKAKDGHKTQRET